MKKLSIIIASGVVALTLQGAVTEFTYNPNPQSTEYTGYGFSKKETYDVAVHLDDPTLVGGKIVGLRVAIPAENTWIKDISGWLSTELKLDKKVNAPDIASVPGTMDKRVISATFAEPYTIPAEGVYVGYSFTVAELGDYSTMPVACVQGESAGSFYLHSSRTRLKWTDEHADTGYVSAMVITVQTESGDTDVAVSLDSETFIVKGEKGMAHLSLVNYGTQPLREVGYTWSAGETSGKGTYTLATPLEPGARTTAGVEVGPFPTACTMPMTVTADTFNGSANGDPRRTTTGTLVVMPFMPTYRPLVEEFTGLRCGYCPMGYVMMEQMAEEKGNAFVGMAYHSSSYETGCMVVMPNSDFPVDVPEFPYCSINRQGNVELENLKEAWTKECATVAPADIDVTLEWADEAHSSLRAAATVDFVREYKDADMSLAIAITADGLFNPLWHQSNNFAGYVDQYTGPLWDIFTKGGRVVPGLTFNQVVVKFDDVKGVAGTVPAVIGLDTHPSHRIELPLTDIVNVSGEMFLNAGSSLRAVAMLIDNKTGRVLNANKSATSLAFNDSGVEAIGSDVEVTEVTWTDMQGCRVATPAPGQFLIKTERLSDGTLRHTKQIYR